VSWRAAASLFALLATATVPAAPAALAPATPTPAGLVCEQQSPRELAAQADVVFAGTITALVEDHDIVKVPPSQLQPVLRFWPKQVPVPTVPTRAPGPGTPAARFQVATAYKGVVTTQMTIRLLGTQRLHAGETWTVFADRSSGHLFTTECSGDQRGPIDAASYGLTGHPPTAPPRANGPPVELFWALALLAVAALLGGAGLAVWLALPSRRRPAAGPQPG